MTFNEVGFQIVSFETFRNAISVLIQRLYWIKEKVFSSTRSESKDTLSSILDDASSSNMINNTYSNKLINQYTNKQVIQQQIEPVECVKYRNPLVDWVLSLVKN